MNGRDEIVAGIAGTIIGRILDRILVIEVDGKAGFQDESVASAAQTSVTLARAIVAEVERTTPVRMPA